MKHWKRTKSREEVMSSDLNMLILRCFWHIHKDTACGSGARRKGLGGSLKSVGHLHVVVMDKEPHRRRCDHRRGWNSRKLSQLINRWRWPCKEDKTVREVGRKSGRIPGKAERGGLYSMDRDHTRKDSSPPTTGKREERLGTSIFISVHHRFVNHDCPSFSWFRVPVICGQSPYSHTHFSLLKKKLHMPAHFKIGYS